jgi:hypothetical protein
MGQLVVLLLKVRRAKQPTGVPTIPWFQSHSDQRQAHVVLFRPIGNLRYRSKQHREGWLQPTALSLLVMLPSNDPIQNFFPAGVRALRYASEYTTSVSPGSSIRSLDGNSAFVFGPAPNRIIVFHSALNPLAGNGYHASLQKDAN